MIWQIIIVVSAAIASYFIPTPKELQEVFSGAQNLYASSNYQKAIIEYDYIIGTNSKFLRIDSVKVTLLGGELTVGVVNAAYYQKGNALRQLNKPDSAISIFRIVEARPDEPQLSALAQFQIYDIFYSKKMFLEAAKEARVLVSKYPKHKKAESALYDIGWCYRELNNLAESDKAFLELVNNYPETEYLAKALYQLGQNNYEQKRFKEAINYWSILHQKFKPEAFKDQEWEKVQLKSVRERQIFEASSNRETESSVLELVAKSQVKIGDAYRELNNYDSAMVNYRKVIINYTLLPVLIEVTYIKMAEYTVTAKGLDEGVKIYKSAIDANFANKELQAKFQYKIAELYQKENKFKEAADEFLFYARAYEEVAQNINFTVEDALYTRVICLYNAEDYLSASTSIDTFMIAYPTSEYNYDLLFLNGVSHFSLKKFDEAKTIFGEVIKVSPGGLHEIPSKVYIGRIELENQNYTGAAEIYRSLLASVPAPVKQKDEINYYLLQALYELKQYDSIPSVFAEISYKSPYFTPSVIKAAKSFTLQKKYQEGEEFIKKLVASADSLKDTVDFRAEANFALADLYIAASRFDDAIKHLNIVVSDARASELLKLQSTFLRGTLYGQTGKHKESIVDLELVLANPVFLDKLKHLVPNARGRLATAYTKTGSMQKGVDMMLSYINSATDTLEKARYLVALTEVYYENKKMDQVITYGEKVIELNVPDDFLYSRAVFLTATAYNAKNNIDKALTLFSNAVEKYPSINEEVFFNFAVNLYDLSYYKNAIAAFTKYVEKYPKSASSKNALFFIGYSYFKLGEWDNSAKSFADFVKVFPEDTYSPEAQYNIAESHYNKGDFASAIKEYQVVYGKYPQSDFAAPAVYNEAWCHYQLKDMDKMITPLQKLIKDYPKHELVAEAQFTLGDYYYNKKDYTKALYEYRTFIEKFPEHYKTEEARSFIKELSQIDAFKEYQKAIAIFDKKDWKNAITALSTIVEKYPDTEIAMACEANIGSAYEQLGDTKKALEIFKNILVKYKDNELASGVLYFAQQHIEWIENATASK